MAPQPYLPRADAFPSSIVQLGNELRVLWPAELRAVAPWISDDAAKNVVVELHDVQWLRLWPESAVEERLRTVAMAIDGNPAAEAVFYDRFRVVVKQKDGRIRLTNDLVIFLGVEPGVAANLFARASRGSAAIELMSLDRRAKLLSEYRAATDL